MQRRTLLCLLGGSLTVSAAGCLGGDSDSGGGDNNSSDDSGGDDANGGDGSEAEASLAIEVTSTPDSVEIGGTLTAEWEVENTGDLEGTQTVVFSVDSLVPEGSQEVTLGGGETTTGEFSYTVTEGDTGELTVTVATDDDTAEATVTVPEPATFAVGITALSPVQVQAGSEVAVPWEVQNTGDLEGTQTLVFSVDGTEEGSQEVTLGGGETTTGEFTYASSEDQAELELSATVASNNSDASVTVIPTGELPDITATIQRAAVGLDADPEEYPERDLTALDPNGPVAVAPGSISDDGTWQSDSPRMPDLTDLISDIELGSVLGDLLEETDIQADIIDEFSLADLQGAVVDLIESLDASEEQAATIGQLVGALDLDIGLPFFLDGVIEGLLLTPQQQLDSIFGFLGIQTTEDLLNTVIGFIDGVEEGDYEGLRQFLVGAVEELDLSRVLGAFSIDIQLEPISGTFDPGVADSALLMTVPLTSATLVPSVDGPGDPPEVDLGLDLTTATSGNLEGDISLDPENNTAAATVVDNEFTLDLGQFDLPRLAQGLDFPGLFETLFETLEIDPDELGFGPAEFADRIDVPALLQNGGVLEFVEFFINDTSGRHAVEATVDMRFRNLESVLETA
jgi:hypothetical protein